jgi:hypothetical protein
MIEILKMKEKNKEMKKIFKNHHHSIFDLPFEHEPKISNRITSVVCSQIAKHAAGCYPRRITLDLGQPMVIL